MTQLPSCSSFSSREDDARAEVVFAHQLKDGLIWFGFWIYLSIQTTKRRRRVMFSVPKPAQIRLKRGDLGHNNFQ